MKRFLLIILTLGISQAIIAQDFKFIKKLIDNPTSNAVGGRRIGESVSISNTQIVIGSSGTTINTTTFPTPPNYISPGYVADVNNDGVISSLQTVDRDRTTFSSRTDFGSSVAVSDNYAVFGEPSYFDANTETQNDATGAVNIFEKVGGVWTFKQRLRPNDVITYGNFGIEVKINGDYIYVGCVPSNGAIGGSVYVFKKDNGGNFIQIQKITEGYSVANATAFFGQKLSISGDCLVVYSRVTAFIYGRANDIFQFKENISIPNLGGAGEANYFNDVSISGDYIVLGAGDISYTTGGSDYKANAGAVYFFKRNSSNLWEFSQRLAANDRVASSKFGSSVSIDGDKVAVAASTHRYDINGINDVFGAGAVYILEKNIITGLWFQKQKIIPFDRQNGGNFGNAIALKGNNLIVGSNVNQNLVNGIYSGNLQIGAAYLFTYKNDVVIPSTFSSVSLAIGKQTKVEITDDNNSPLLSLGTFGAVPLTNNLTTVKVWKESTAPNDNGVLYLPRHYEITPSTNPNTSTATVTLYFNQQEFLDFNSNPAKTASFPTGPTDNQGIANIRITKISGSSNNGTGLMNTYTGTTTTIDPDDDKIIWNATANRWEVTFNVTGFSGFFGTATPTTLPLTLLSFTGKKENNFNKLDWSTAIEENTSHFEIERTLDNGLNFNKVAIVAAKGIGNNIYSYLDRLIDSENHYHYYKLKMVDLDGKFTFSNEVAIKNVLINKVKMDIYPNPVIDIFTLSTNDKSLINKPYKIFDINGIVVNEGLILENRQTIDISKLNTGVYILRLDGKQNIKITKE